MSDLHTVDCDVEPFVPNGWKVEEHKKGGQLPLDLSKIKLHLLPNQKNDRLIEGNELRKKLVSEPVLNANVLDYLLAHQLIPEDWKRDAYVNIRFIFFWGTIYRHPYDYLCVRFLCWNGNAWYWSYHWLGCGWDGYSPAAVLAS